jgi:glycosyltransferase involved in cell wall biosynthesis
MTRKLSQELSMRKVNDDRLVDGVGNRVIVVIPAFNEARFIGSVVLKARKYADEVVVVDDGSKDSTGELARAAGAIVITHAENCGKGRALSTGFQKACNLGADIVVTFDADGQHFPEELDRLVAPIYSGDADLVIGSRYLNPNAAVPWIRTWGHKIFNLLTGFGSGVKVTDSQSGFRAFSRDTLEELRFSSNGFSIESEMQFLAQSRDLRILEVPITARYPDKPKRPVYQHGLLVLNGLLRLTGQYRPLLFFGVPGLFLMLAGGSLGIYIVKIYQRTRELAVGYAMISILLFMLGSISLSTGIILHSIRSLLLELVAPRG